MKLSEADKLAKQKQDNIRRLVNRVLSEFQFKKWRNFHGYLTSLGKPTAGIPDRELTIADVRKLLDEFQDELANASKSKESPIHRGQKSDSVSSVQFGCGDGNVSDTFTQNKESNKIAGQSGKADEEKFTAENNYGLQPCKKETAKLFWFQKKAAKEILDNLLIKKLQAIYLVAQAGSGKTFAIGAVLARLIESGWHKKDTLSPWPIIYVTKASVVTQTQRVLLNDFGIRDGEVTVVAIDQMRARFGQMFVKETMKIVEGEEQYFYTWTPMINPKLIVVDEGHVVKNHTSAQHKIMLSYSDLPNTHMIFISATPATRVSEFKCFVCAAHIDYNLPL